MNIDCEYDKRFDQEKMRSNGKPMRPYIVVHVRNQDTGNKIAIEVKKVHSSKQDVKKLKMLTLKNGPYGYQLGVFIRLPIDEPKYKWFINGEEENI